MNKNELRKNVLEILKLKQQMEEINKKYDRIEKVLLDNLDMEECISTRLGNVSKSMLTRRFINPEIYFNKVDIDKFIKSVNVKIASAQKILGQEVDEISEIKTYDKLCVNIKKISVKDIND